MTSVWHTALLRQPDQFALEAYAIRGHHVLMTLGGLLLEKAKSSEGFSEESWAGHLAVLLEHLSSACDVGVSCAVRALPEICRVLQDLSTGKAAGEKTEDFVDPQGYFGVGALLCHLEGYLP